MAHWEFDVHDWPTRSKQVCVIWSHAWLDEHCDDNLQPFDVVVFVVVAVGVVILGVVAPWHWTISNAIAKPLTSRSLFF